MKSFAINGSVALVLGLGLMLALMWVLGGATLPAAHATALQRQYQPSPLQASHVITVCLSGGCDYDNIQAAMDASSNADVIKVAEGTYTRVQGRPSPLGYNGPSVVSQVVYISKSVTIQGGYTTTNWITPYPVTQHTMLDAQGQGRVLFIAGDISPAIEGLHITNGDATDLGGGFGPLWDAGGGMYVVDAALTLSNCHVFSNSGGTETPFGGGLYLEYSNATLVGNTIISNTAFWGGAVHLWSSDATLANNTITSNTARVGGGLYVYDSVAEITKNTISCNAAGSGGGLSSEGGELRIVENTIISNTASCRGGGLLIWKSDALLNGNIIVSNSASSNGGGLGLISGHSKLVNNVIADNRADASGSGLYAEASTACLLYNTIARNHGGDGSGLVVSHSTYDPPHNSNVALTNTVLVSHNVGISVTGGNTVTINSILWHSTPVTMSKATTATVTLQNQYDDNPAFALDGYHLTIASAAIDKGVATGIDEDIDGDPRPQGGGYDIGADEYTDTQLDPVSDLCVGHALTDTATLTVTLTWSAPPNAVTHALRYSSSLITDEDWATAIGLTDALPGDTSAYTVAVPYSGSSVYFALRYSSACGEESPVSNNAFWPRWDVYLPLVLRNA